MRFLYVVMGLIDTREGSPLKSVHGSVSSNHRNLLRLRKSAMLLNYDCFLTVTLGISVTRRVVQP